ncbi:hypothetical protein CLV59_105302 [Chitinophaga dinghuensis]|uniref:Uncharacterized protein n=1 Tax=Chitinophaga dinghuensis TaxID=1539050 RepID=A0A327VZL3_9BACT|nr:hypothetical protein [Chitinophaga dinghuensis]RAJ80194.1 hypothetical protein CLV59_105302 [Chitinophaga dinghuensis]
MFYLFAIVLTNLHLIYHQITTHIDLFPFNNVREYTRKEQLTEAAIHFISMGFPVLALLSDCKIMALVAAVELGLMFAGEIYTWWTAYFFGARFAWQSNWKELHQRIFSKTIIMLPARGKNPAPNLEHCILHILTLLSGIACLLYYIYG